MSVALTYDFKDQIRQMQANVDLVMQNSPYLFSLIGTGDPLLATKFEWQNDYLNSDLAIAGAAAAVDTTTVQLESGDAGKVVVNALIQNGLEVLRVVGVNDTDNTVEVQRGYDNTVPEAIEAGGELKVISRPRPEGADALRKDEAHDRILAFNYSQIFERYAAVSRTQQAVRTYGVENELDYQVNLRLQEMIKEMNNTLIYGRKYAGAPNMPRTTGGLFAFANEQGSFNKDFGGQEIDAKGLNDAVEAVFTRGGNVNTIVCAPNVARQISKIAGNTIQTTREDTATGHRVLTFVSDLPGGAITSVAVDANMPKDRTLLIDSTKVKARYLTPVYDQDATIPGGDYFSRTIRSEMGFEIKNAKESIAVLSGLSKTIS